MGSDQPGMSAAPRRPWQGRRVAVSAAIFPPTANAESIVNGKLGLALLAAGADVFAVRSVERGRVGPRDRHLEAPWEPLSGRVLDVSTRLPPQSSRRHRVAELCDRARALLRGVFPVHFAGWAVDAATVLLAEHDRQPFDVLLSRSLPEHSHLAALLLKRRTGVKWIANWNDPPPGVRPAPYGPGLAGRVPADLRPMLRAVAREADGHTFPSARLRKYMGSALPELPVERCAVVPHVAMSFGSTQVQPDPGTMVLSHVGDVTPPRDPEPLLAGVTIALSRRAGLRECLRLRFIGASGRGLAEGIRRHQLQGLCEMSPPVPYLPCFDLCRRSDVLVLIEAPMETSVFLPSKLADYVACRRPVLALTPTSSEVRDLLQSQGGGIAVRPDAPVQIAEALLRLHDDWQRGELARQWPSDGLARRLAPDAALDRLASLLS